MSHLLQKKQAVNDNGVVVSLDPEAIDLDQGTLQEKYEEQLRKQRKTDDNDDNDLTDMVAEHSAKQNVCFQNFFNCLFLILVICFKKTYDLSFL